MSSSLHVVLCLIILSITNFSHQQQLSCRNEDGTAVDWFVVYKIPYLQQDPSRILRSGFSYAFISGPPLDKSITRQSDHQQGWTLSNKQITNDDSIFAQTLNPLFKEPNSFTHLMYSDAPSINSTVRESIALAHAKGVLALDETTGFWLVHSVPLFPDPPIHAQKYSYPRSGRDNGQSALCISISTKEASKIITQLLYMRANVYSNWTTPQAVKSIPELDQLGRRKWPKGRNENIIDIDTLNGEKFTSFVRGPKSLYKDLYVDFMAPQLKTDLLVETWRRGAGGPLTSNCTYAFKVNNIKSIELFFTSKSSVDRTIPWSYLEDHSKWAVSVSKNLTCIGDLNRMASQSKRGGGSVCFSDANVWQTTSKSIHDVEVCPRNGTSNDQTVTDDDQTLTTDDKTSPAEKKEPFFFKKIFRWIFNRRTSN